MTATYNGRTLTDGQFAVVIDGVTYFGVARSWTHSRRAGEVESAELGGIITESSSRASTPAAVEAATPRHDTRHTHLRVTHINYNHLPVRGEEHLLYLISREGELLPCAYVYRPTLVHENRHQNTLPYKPTNISALAVSAGYDHGSLLPHSMSNNSFVVRFRVPSTVGDVQAEPLLLSGSPVWLDGSLQCSITGPTLTARSDIQAINGIAPPFPEVNAPPEVELAPNALAGVSVPQVSPQTARDIMTSGWRSFPPIDVRAALSANAFANLAAEEDRRFMAAVNAEFAPEMAAAPTEAQETVAPTVAPLVVLLVRYIGHSDELPARGNFNTLYCVLGYPMAFIYRENVVNGPGVLQGITGYFPTNVDASAVARQFSDGAFMPVDSAAGSVVLDSSCVRFAYNHDTLLLARCGDGAIFGVDEAFLLSSGPSALWTGGPWFHRRAVFDFARAAVRDSAADAVNDFTRIRVHEDNFFRRIFPTVTQSFPASPIDPPQPHDDDDVPAPVAESAAVPNRRRLILD
jgi:hypothetical protein